MLFFLGIVLVIAFIVFVALFISSIVHYHTFYAKAKEVGLAGAGGYFKASDYNAIATQIGTEAGASDPALYGAALINANYTQYGDLYWFYTLNPNDAPHINWIFMVLMIAFGLCAIVSIIASLMLRKKVKLMRSSSELI